MKFNKLARELDFSVSELAEKVKDILPNANGGTEVSGEHKAQIIARLKAPEPNSLVSFLAAGSSDPILSVLAERIEQEEQQEAPEQLVNQMIERYLANPEDLPADSEYREAIITYVALVKKRYTRRQQLFSSVRSRLSKQALQPGEAAPLTLESFYSSDRSNGALGSSANAPQLNAAST